MARKKNWLEYDSLEYLNKTKSNDLDISWSSSSSETEDTVFYKYRKKIKKDNDLNSVNHFKVTWEITPPKLNTCLQNLSPVIGKSHLELSPPLNKNNNDNRGDSPIIGAKSSKKVCNEHKIIKKLVHSESFNEKFKLLNTNSDSTQPDISVYSSSSESHRDHLQVRSQFSEESDYINTHRIHKTQLETRNTDIDLIESVSEASNDIFSQEFQPVKIDSISPSKSQSGCSFTISQFSTSQESRNFLINEKLNESNSESGTNISSESLLISSHENVLYYHKAPRKKKYKKGRLMNQLQKALKNKKCNISMWQHELYLGKTDFGQDFLHLHVLRIIVEFNCRICICHLINGNTHEDDHEEYILVLDLLIDHDVQCLQNLKVYMPYSKCNLRYCDKNYCCYYNVSKVLFDG